MLPPILRGPCRFDFRPEEWTAYLAGIGRYAQRVDHQFLRQVPYDHFDHFNAHYPWFDIDNVRIERINLAAADVYTKVRYFDSKPLDFWHTQYDEFSRRKTKDYEVFKDMVTNLTWPFPPIVLRSDGARGLKQPLGNLGQPLHLVEGTHRVSYLCRMLELKMVKPMSLHKLVIVTPNRTVDPDARKSGARGLP